MPRRAVKRGCADGAEVRREVPVKVVDKGAADGRRPRTGTKAIAEERGVCKELTRGVRGSDGGTRTSGRWGLQD